jgi:hypothetical protein
MNYSFLATEKVRESLEEGQRSQAFYKSDPKRVIRTKTSKMLVSIVVVSLFIFLLSACGGGQTESHPADDSSVEPVSQPVVEPTLEPTLEPTAEPTPEPTSTPEIEPEIVDLGNGARLLLRGLPEDVTLDASLDAEFKDDIPPSKNFDWVHTDTVIVNIIKGGEFFTLDKGVVELCFTTTEPNTALGDPKPYYWDTSISPLVDGRGLRISEKQKEPEYMLCTMVQNSGAYAIVAW